MHEVSECLTCSSYMDLSHIVGRPRILHKVFSNMYIEYHTCRRVFRSIGSNSMLVLSLCMPIVIAFQVTVSACRICSVRFTDHASPETNEQPRGALLPNYTMVRTDQHQGLDIW